VIVDMQMPDMDGLTLAREIRRHRAAAALPIVMLTSLGREREDRASTAELTAYLTKPIKASQLYNALMAAIGAELAGAQELAAPEPDAAPPPREELRVLLVEDNAVNQRVALRLLEKLGHRASSAATGLEALEALRRRPYDVVLMDVEMPEMDGLEASRHIHREWPPDERPQIIAMTANAMQGYRDICLAAGMDDYLTKPIHMDDLAKALNRCAPRPAVLGERPQPEPPPPEEGRVLDPEALEQLGAGTGDRAFVAELIATFLGEAPALLETIRGSLERDQAEELRRAAHTLKSNGRIFGATRLAELCQELEAMATAETAPGAVDLVAQLDREYPRVEGALRAAAGQAMT
jgi:CheY-like chemotaxis protein/HPt (histidine-containing phosphotransfer) domain-containing protein